MKRIPSMLLPWLLIFLLAPAGLAACGGNAGGASGSSQRSALLQALALAPATVTDFAFTDWSALTQYKGAQGLTSKSDKDARQRFLVSLNQDQALASAYGVDYALAQDEASLWSWDSTDLIWESTVSPGPPVYTLRLRDDFDFTPVAKHFEERGFHKETYREAALYTHRLDLTVDWAPPLGIFNTAILASAKLLILSSSPDSVRSVLDVFAKVAGSLADDAAFAGVATQLSGAASAELAPGAYICSRIFDVLGPRVTPEQLAQLRQTVADAGQVHVYGALGVGYHDEQSRPVGLLVFHYAASGDAQVDLAARRTLASTASSLLTNKPYSDEVFSVEAATASGSDLVLRVRPVQDQPQRLFIMWYSRDLLFAACPP